MAFILKPLRCPYCKKPMDKRLLQQHQRWQACQHHQAFTCVHCQRKVAYPQNADNLLVMGLFISAILTPVFYLSNIHFIAPKYLFGLGIVIIMAGLMTQRLVKTK